MNPYLDEFIRLNKSGGDMLVSGLFPNAKEITESMGAYYAAKYLAEQLNFRFDENIAVVSVGDGITPRTAGLFAFRTKSHCISVDPMLRAVEWPIERLWCYKTAIEDVELDFVDDYEHVIILMVHSHAPMKKTLNSILGKRRHVICIPCCIQQYLSMPGYCYQDNKIESPKNIVYIWSDV